MNEYILFKDLKENQIIKVSKFSSLRIVSISDSIIEVELTNIGLLPNKPIERMTIPYFIEMIKENGIEII